MRHSLWTMLGPWGVVSCLVVSFLLSSRVWSAERPAQPGRFRLPGERAPNDWISPVLPQKWERLPDMTGELGRFALASDGRSVYRLGGVSYNIRSGGNYSRQFAAFHPAAQIWQNLPDAPFGTGGASLAYWPDNERLVAIAGIDRLGDTFDTDAVEVGIYDPANGSWATKRIDCPGLGRPAWLVHVKDGQFLVLTSDPYLSAGKNVALLDLDDETLRIVGECPVTGRMASVARIDDTLYVLQSKSRTASRLHRLDIQSGKHLGSVELDEEFTHVDTMFSLEGKVCVWKNSGPYDRNRYQHTSKVLQVAPGSGKCTSVESGNPGPRARRSSSGITCSKAFYVFGGQRTDDVWLNDVYRFQF